MGSVQLQVDVTRGWIGPAQGFDPSQTSGVLPAGQIMGLLSDGDTSDRKQILLGDGSSSTDQWNHFYLTAPALPSGALVVQLQSTWFLEADFGNTSQVVIQSFPEPYTAGEVRIVPITTSPAGYAANFTWNPAWPNNSIRFSVLGNVTERVTEVIAVLYYADPPSASFSLPATNGTVFTGTVRPQFQWLYTQGGVGGPQSAFRFLVYTAAQTTQAGFVPGAAAAVWDSGIVRSGNPTYTMPVNLANNTNYVAYLTVAQRVGGVDQWAAVWATRSFTIQIPPAAVPARPTITATVNNATAGIDLSVTQSGGTPSWSHVLVERSRDAGTTWETVRSGDVDVAAGATLAFSDYETGNGEAARYRATAELATTVGGITQISVSSPSVATADVAWTSTSIWLKAPLMPALNQIVDVRSQTTNTRRNPRGLFDIAGRALPVAVSDTRRATEGSVVFYTPTSAASDAFLDLLDLADTLLLQFPAGQGWGSKYISLGDASEERVVPEVAFNQQRFHTVAFTEVDAPVGDAVITTPVVVVVPGGHLLDVSGNFLTDAAGNRLTNQ